MASKNDPLKLLDAAVAGIKGERREGQHELAAAVAEAIADQRHLVAEAPTGSGKSLAYLAPAVASGLKVVVATSTIALQSQLVGKDLPVLHKHGKVSFSFGLLKGRANYLCLAKLKAAGQPDALFDTPVVAAFSKHLEHLESFAKTTELGDRADLVKAIADSSWSAVSCTSSECPGRTNCADGEECFAELARSRAQDVDVLVVNHALYCADLASHGNVLPPHDLVIIDEAHSFPDNATNAFGADLSAESIVRLSGMLLKAGVEAETVDALAGSAKELGAVLERWEGRVDVGTNEPLSSALHVAAERLATANTMLGKADNDSAKRTGQIALARLEVLRRLGEPAEDDVVWIEKNRNTRRIRVAPVSVGAPLASMLLSERPVIAVSATLGGETPFAAFAEQMGFDPDAKPDEERGYTALHASSSFDWKDQGLLYVGSDLPDPRHAAEPWLRKAGDRLCRLVNAAGGRALVLCTSRANVDRFAELLRDRTDHFVLAQGDADVGKLTRQFIEDEASVLVGTRSFWAGIDVPGVACLMVVIDRIPFPPLSDPLHTARQERAEQNGQNAFATVDLPAAALVLAQGAGRLIRTKSDRGVVAVLDSRLAKQSYRSELLAAMPPFSRSIDVDEAIAFLKDAAKRVPASRMSTTMPKPVTEAETIAALSPTALAEIRKGVVCPECGAAAGERCHDPQGFTMAFMHDARVAGADA